MTPSQQAKAHGLKSLRQLSLIALVPVSTLKDWARDKPERFKRVCEMAEAWYFKPPVRGHKIDDSFNKNRPPDRYDLLA